MSYYGPVLGGGDGVWLESRETNETLGEWISGGPSFDPLNEAPSATGGSVWDRGTHTYQPPAYNFPRATGAVVDHTLAEHETASGGFLIASMQRFATAGQPEDETAVEYVPMVGQLGVSGTTDPDRYIPMAESYWPTGATGIEKVSDTVITAVQIEVKVENVAGPPNPPSWYPSTVVAVESERPPLPADGFPLSLQVDPQITLPVGSWITLDTMLGTELTEADGRFYQFIIDWLLAAGDQTEIYGTWVSQVHVKTTYSVTFGQYRFIYAASSDLDHDTAPPLRQYPRTDGLAMSSARRVWPPSRSRQRSNRRAGHYD